MNRHCGAVLLLSAGLAACAPPSPDAAPPAAPEPVDEPTWFTDVTAASGVDLVTRSGVTPSTQILEVKGGGLAVLDLDGDGDHDLFVPNGATLAAPYAGPGARLYRNDGRGVFTDATAEAGLTFAGWGMGVAAGDADGDGHVDLYLACYGRDVLLRNRGDGTFEDVTEASGLGLDGWSAQAAWGDLDADGDLDLYVTRYVDFDCAAPPAPSIFRGAPVLAGPRGLPALPDVLYENLGDGTFRDVTERTGAGAGDASYGLGVVILDFDGDGRQDIFVGNDSRPNFLFLNDGVRGAMHFEEAALRRGVATTIDGSSRATMGIGLADVNDDGRPDLFTTNFSGEPNTLHLGREGGFFDDGTSRFAVGMPGRSAVGWSALFADLDHDRDEDLLVVNGHVYPNATQATMFSDYRQAPQLLERDGGRFTPVTPVATDWLAQPRCARTLVLADLDGDGDLDGVCGGVNEPIQIIRNERGDGAWLHVAPVRPLGCRIEVFEPGRPAQRRWLASGVGFMSSGPRVAHFGLGDAAGPVSVEVTWPDGFARRLGNLAVNQRVEVRR